MTKSGRLLGATRFLEPRALRVLDLRFRGWVSEVGGEPRHCLRNPGAQLVTAHISAEMSGTTHECELYYRMIDVQLE